MDTKLNDKPLLSPHLSLRAVKWTDINAVAQLIYDVCEANGDTTVAVTPEELKIEWQDPALNLETDAWLVETNDNRVVGFEEFYNAHAHAVLQADGYVHPEFKGKGIGTTLLRAFEERARKEMELTEPGLRVSLKSSIDSHDESARALHENEGYHTLRFFWRMEINLQGPPPAPLWPAGMELRPFIKGKDDRSVWEADQEAFLDHWGSHPISFEDWKHRKFSREDFDPTLWIIAWDDEQIAGVCENRYRMGIGWIGTLGVRRPWRKKGLGLALLLHSFGEFYKRGKTTIGLGVDASNPTGATRLYQKAGMHVASEFVTYEKELRPGRSLEE